jgi:hypothetical protein
MTQHLLQARFFWDESRKRLKKANTAIILFLLGDLVKAVHRIYFSQTRTSSEIEPSEGFFFMPSSKAAGHLILILSQ